MQAVVLSPGIRRIPHLAAFLPEVSGITSRLAATGDGRARMIFGWGHKPTSRRARALAESHGLPYCALEDGFLRSFGLSGVDEPPLSLVVDPVGIHYDATRPSRLEHLLADGGWQREALLQRAERVAAMIREFRLSKYNAQPDKDLSALRKPGRRTILVIDQTVGDASVALGLAGPESFRTMLARAEADEPGARIVVKVHPDVVAGRKRGYLNELGVCRGHTVIAEPVNPWSLFDVADKVYTVTSQLGLEALIAGLPVRCFGLPFYAGWGLTEDEVCSQRRTVERSLPELIAAAYLLYPRYVDPFTGAGCQIEDTIALLADLKRHYARNQRASVCLGFSRWKRGFVRRFLASPQTAPVVFSSDAERALEQARKLNRRLVVWASAEPRGLAERAADAGVALWRMEDGFLRSVGLGCTLTRPNSLVADECGIHFDPHRESGIERLLLDGPISPSLIERARRLRTRIVRARVTKYNLGGQPSLPTPPGDGRRRILIAGQVEDDASVRCSGAVVRSNAHLLQAVRESAPDAWIAYKPHPDVEAGLRRGAVDMAAANRWCDAVVTDASIVDLIEMVDEVHTVSSLAGFEALLRDRKVTVYGAPFYAGWGLTTDRVAVPRRCRTASLDELVAAALILYPLYLDPVSGRPCTVETVIDRLAANATATMPGSRLRHLRRWLLRPWAHLRPAPVLATVR